MRITVWIAKFLFNTRNPTERRHGVLTTAEIREQVHWWIKKYQLQFKIEEDKSRLNMEENELGWVCCARAEFKAKSLFISFPQRKEKIVMHEHVQTLHGGLRMTMAAVRRCYWIPHPCQSGDNEIPPIWAHGRTVRAD